MDKQDRVFYLTLLFAALLILGSLLYLWTVDCKHLSWLPAKDVPARCVDYFTDGEDN